MLNPRLYRAALAPIVVAVILAAFSLQDLPLPVGSTQAPDAFQGASAAANLAQLAARFESRRPGGAGDDGLARTVAADLRAAGSYRVRTLSTATQTVDGQRMVKTVIATRAGGPGSQIVVVADREALGRGARAQLSGTAVLLELARVLSQGPVNRTITFVSTSGDGGGAAAAAAALQRPVDAVLVLGDMASTRVRQPLVTAWSDGGGVAPLRLQRTVALALRQETGIVSGTPGTGTQLARFAFPVAFGDQGVFGKAGLPAVAISVSGERPAAADEHVDLTRMTAFGHAVLRAVTALDRGPDVGAPPAKVLITGRKSIPSWAMRVLVAVLALAPLVCAVDGFARLRRRREPIAVGVIWIICAAAPFVAACVVTRLEGLLGLLPAVPPTAVPPGAIPIDGTARIAMFSVVLVFALAWLAARALAAAPAVGADRLRGTGASGALLLVLCALAVVVWAINPFAALLLVPALHLWLPIYAPGVALRRRAALALVILGLAPFALVALADASSLGLRADDLAWLWLLLTAGGHVGVGTWVVWSLFCGCVLGTIVLALRSAPPAPSVPAPVTVRGPLSYAGPGSLGGTDSALRR